ncbi:MAG TPA: NAD-dependent epimerase/dehydratase family protein [Chloroflexota bacterium]|nr:NAD-dependent epimerase/dehydratase family protein [Chloroflexota bacterium]
MRVLIIGGTRFMGYWTTWRALLAGHEVTLLNRGATPDPFGGRVERLVADRTTPRFGEVLAGRAFDAAIDFAAYTGADAQGVVDTLRNRLGHYVMISSGQVYLVKQQPPAPARETDYPGPLLPAPPRPEDTEDWEYGMGKRAAEDVLSTAWERERFPATRIRIPIVNGERDRSGRLESYLWRILDGGPILLPDGDERRVRHVYSGAVARTLVDILGRQETFGQAYNLAQEEVPTLTELVRRAARLMGATPEIRSLPAASFREAGVEPEKAFPFTGRWASLLDPRRAADQLGFRHEPLDEYLGRIIAAFLSNLPSTPPCNAGRGNELALAEHQEISA